MLDINLIRNDPEKVRENIRKKFQDAKLPMVDEVIALDREFRDAIQQGDALRNKRKTISKEIGGLMGKGLKEEAEKLKAGGRAGRAGSEGRGTEGRDPETDAGDPEYHRRQRADRQGRQRKRRD